MAADGAFGGFTVRIGVSTALSGRSLAGAPTASSMAAAAEAEEVDERFEYDAPRFYDFDEGSPAGAGPADGWFDTEGPKGLTSPVAAPKDQQKNKATAAAGSVAGAADNKSPQNQQGEAGDGKTTGKGKESGRRVLASISNTAGTGIVRVAAAVQPAAKAAASGSKRKAAGSAGEGSGAAAAVARGTSRSRPASATQHQQRTSSRQGDAPSSSAAAAAPTSQAAASSPRHRVRQRAPLHHTHHPGEQKSSEQLELERVEREKEVAAALRRRNAEAVKHVLGVPPPPVPHSSRPLTEPVPLELCTSKRRRKHGMETRSMGSPYKSTAEQIAAFEGRFPGKTRLGGEAGDGHSGAEQQQHHHHAHTLTVPQSPHFATKQRVRAARFKPREVVEAEEMAAMPKFKARPVNKRIMRDASGQSGVPHVDVKAPTVPAPFAFKTDQRAVEHASSAGHSSHGPSSSSAAPAAGAGEDGVFVFAATGGMGARVTRSKAASKKAAAAVGSGWTGELTHPEPFQLATDARGANKRVAAAEAQHEAQDARGSKRARHAAPPGPFHLATDARGAAEEVRLEGMRRQQEVQARREAEFKALPLNKAALAGTWKPAHAAAAELTVPQEMTLHSDVRAEQRRAFDAAVAVKQAEMEAERQEVQELQAAAEEEEVRALRKRLGHKALPPFDQL